MTIRKVGILTSSESWFVPYAQDLTRILKWWGYESAFYAHHSEIVHPHDVLFILSYFRKVPSSTLRLNRFNLVVHESELPRGKGWSPLFWQILEGHNRIPIVLLEASEKIDSGPIYLKDYIELSGYELHDEIRQHQAHKTLELCIRFLRQYPDLTPMPQQGKATFYPRRTPKNSQLDIHKSLYDQFNLLRIVDNTHYPAYFVIDGHQYILHIHRSVRSTSPDHIDDNNNSHTPQNTSS